MADSNRTQIRFCEEDTWGTTPSTRALQELRITGESMAYNVEYITSSEIRTDRQVTDLIQTGADASGGFDFELSYTTFDKFMESALWSTFSSDLGLSLVTMTADVASSHFISSVTDAFATIVTGQWIKMGGGWTKDSNGNRGYYMVTGAAPLTITVTPAPATDETASAAKGAITIAGSHMSNGTTEKSFSIERRHDDLDPDVYFSFSGMVVNNFSMSVQANAVLSGSFDFVGKSTVVSGGSMSSGSVTSANTNDLMNAVTDVGNILENDTAVSDCLVQGIDFTVSNNIRGLDAIGSLGNCDLGVGQIDVTGTLSAYFQNKDLYDKYVNSTNTSISFRVDDGGSGTGTGNTYIFTFHKVKFESDALNASGPNTDIIESIGWRAIRHSAGRDMTVSIDKFASA